MKDGWEPLCSFLGVPVPPKPFPSVNATEDMRKAMVFFNASGWIMFLVAVTLAAVGAWAATEYFGKCAGGLTGGFASSILLYNLFAAWQVSRVGRKTHKLKTH